MEAPNPSLAHRDEHLGLLATLFYQRGSDTGNLQDLDKAIVVYRQAVEICPTGHPDRHIAINNLGTAIYTRFSQTPNSQDLEEAIQLYREALELKIPHDSDRGSSFSNLARVVRLRFEQTGAMKDLDEAIELHQKSLKLYPPGHPDRASSCGHIANAVLTRFNQVGKMQDLEDAIDLTREVLEHRPPGHPSRSSSLSILATALLLRYGQNGKRQDLDEGLDLHQKSLELRPPGDSHRATSLNNFASAVLTRFEHTGNMQDLDEAIDLHRQALELRVPGHPNRSMSYNNLANAFFIRYNQTGDIQDLDEAIDLHRRALELHPLGHPDRSSSLTNLANAILVRFDKSSAIQDVEEAIHLSQQALELQPPGHPDRAMTFNNLANAVLTLFEQAGAAQDLEEAIDLYSQALDNRPPGHLDRGSYLLGLYKALGYADADQETITRCLLEAVDAFPELHPVRARAMCELGEMYLTRYELQETGIPSLDVIFSLLEDASNHPTAMLKHRLAFATGWAARARKHNHGSVLRAYTTALALLNRTSVMTPTLDDQHGLFVSETMNDHRSLTSDAASSAIESGKLETAIELLEQGRAILWSRMRGFRHSLLTLGEVDPDLESRFKAVSRQLQVHATSSSNLKSNSRSSFEAQERQYRRLSEEWDGVVERIRKVEGFEYFLRPVPFSTLRKAASEGPVIVVNISRYRSDAIIIVRDADPILVPLPGVMPDMLVSLAIPFRDPRAQSTVIFSKSISPVLRNLWRLVAQPVVEKLVEFRIPNRSRIWWCPTAELCALPIHAAGPYLPGQKGLLDLYIPSYTPTIHALVLARSNPMHAPTIAPTMLIVAPSDLTLPSVEEEIRRIQKFGDFDALLGSEASPSAVTSRLRGHRWVHFACHGHRNPESFHSSFELHAGARLELLDVMKAHLPDAELAFLSACHSAAVDQKAPDESINLASALQFCGFRSVVGTLWAMADEDGPTVAEAFYQHMFRESGHVDFRDSAEALNLAIRQMRRRGVPLARWVPFVHIGA